MRLLRNRLTYSNVTATLALIVALGGTSYAAFSLPRNSVGASQIRTGAVRSAEVKNGSLATKDLSAAARRSLRGAAGPQGPAGAQGPQGPAAAEFFAVIKSDGDPAAGNATAASRLPDIGTYSVGFARSLQGCAIAATLGTADATTTAPGRITVNLVNGQAGVQTYGPDGTPTDLPFHLIAAC